MDLVKTMDDSARPPPTSVTHTLYCQAAAAKALIAQMAEALGEDAQAKADLIEGETGLNEAVRAAAARLAELDTMIAALKARAKEIAGRMARFHAQDQAIRTAILVAFEEANIALMEIPEATISRRRVPPKAVIVSEERIPAKFWKQPAPVLDKRALLEALEAREAVPGAELSNGAETLAVRFA